MPPWADPVLELSRTEREALRRIHEKRAAEQLGEAFRDLPAQPEQRHG